MKLLAYVDPGTGALLWQAIVAAFVGTMFYLKKTRDWIVGALVKIFRRGPKEAGSKIPEKIEGKVDPS